jgi:hypothetical protein
MADHLRIPQVVSWSGVVPDTGKIGDCPECQLETLPFVKMGKQVAQISIGNDANGKMGKLPRVSSDNCPMSVS